jgi:hypothetical protein
MHFDPSHAMSRPRQKLPVLLVALAALAFGSANAEISLTLKNTFIEKYKNRTSIADDCVVDHSKGKPNPASADGDMHSAVRCHEIALPLVAEIMNARDHTDAIDLSKVHEDSGERVTIRGAWRIWNEHGGDQVFKQGSAVAKAESSNPDHVFEIHPITEFGAVDVRASFKPIPGFRAKDAEDAFNRYENTRSRIIPARATTPVVSPGFGYNYVEFQMALADNPFPVQDGSFAYAKVRDWNGDLLLRKKRMVFVKDTPPELAVRGAGAAIASSSWAFYGWIWFLGVPGTVRATLMS